MKVSERISILANVLEVACSRPNNEVGKLVKAVVSYANEGIRPALDDIRLETYFDLIAHDLDTQRNAAEVKSREMFFRVANAAFALRRKTMVNNLCATFRAERAQALAWMEAAGLDEKIRGEKLTIEELARLADAISNSQFIIHNS